jgi:hypothetical protein
MVISFVMSEAFPSRQVAPDSSATHRRLGRLLSFALGSVLSLLVLGNPPWRHPPPGRRQPAS